MKYYRCKCGKHETWGSMSPHPCFGCEDCGTTLEDNPKHHRKPVPHDWHTEQVETDEGPKPLTTCRYCGKARHEI